MAILTRRLTGVIDWGDAMIGDPARDFIFLYEDWDQEFLELALTGYGWRGEAELLARVLVLYMADQLEWTLEAAAEGRVRDVSHGIDALAQAVNDFAVVGERSVSAPPTAWDRGRRPTLESFRTPRPASSMISGTLEPSAPECADP